MPRALRWRTPRSTATVLPAAVFDRAGIGLPEAVRAVISAMAAYLWNVASQSSIEAASRPASEGTEELTHGYPPPAQPPGTEVVAYCGAAMTVRGESSASPPPDTCPDCAAIWRRRRRSR